MVVVMVVRVEAWASGGAVEGGGSGHGGGGGRRGTGCFELLLLLLEGLQLGDRLLDLWDEDLLWLEGYLLGLADGVVMVKRWGAHLQRSWSIEGG